MNDSARAHDEQDTWDAGGASAAAGAAPSRPVPRHRGERRGVDDAMRERELAAMRGFVGMVVLLTSAVAASLPFLLVGYREVLVLSIGMVVALLGALHMSRALHRGDIHPVDMAVFGIACLIGSSAGLYFFGFFSPAPLATIMGVFFFGMQRSPVVATLLYAGTALVHGACMLLLTFTEVITDHGLVDGDDVTRRNRVVMLVLVQIVYALVFYLSRAVHRAVRDAAIRLEDTTRAVAHREALLEEARRELERALEVGGPGRFTEQRLGSWQLGVLCGRGAMADVYHATHATTGEHAAVKLLHRDAVQNPAFIRRFLREARIAGTIEVPNVVRVLDVGDEEAPVPYIAMELLEGKDLAAMLRRQRRLPAEQVVDLLRQVGRGLDAAHRKGVVHRDLKPQNLFLADTGAGAVWKILDFGVCRLIDVASSITHGQAIGTPSYMSPEQARGRDVDHRADLFALGVLAYRALTGRPAFTGSEIPQILYSVVHAMPPRPSDLVTLPRAVDDVLAVAMAKAPADRFDSAAAFVDALERALAGEESAELRAGAEKLAARMPWEREVQPVTVDESRPIRAATDI